MAKYLAQLLLALSIGLALALPVLLEDAKSPDLRDRIDLAALSTPPKEAQRRPLARPKPKVGKRPQVRSH